jgi:hypothetical protein
MSFWILARIDRVTTFYLVSIAHGMASAARIAQTVSILVDRIRDAACTATIFSQGMAHGSRAEARCFAWLAAACGYALGTLALGTSCTGEIGDSSDPETTTAPDPGGAKTGDNAATTSCEPTQLLASRLVRLASSELRDLVRDSLPGVNEMLIQGIDLQAEHVAPISERVISSADFSAYYQAALSVADAYATQSSEAGPCRTGSSDSCLNGVVRQAITRLFRRPPTSEEWTQASASFQRLVGSQGAVRAAAGVVAGAILSPQTVYHVETSQPVTTDKATLSRSSVLEQASFALTGRAPGPEAKALEGLTDGEFPAALGKLVASWAQGADFRRRGLDFSEDRFGVQHMAELSRSDPAFTATLKTALTGEFREFVSASLFPPGGDFSQLFTKSPSRVFPGLEGLYDPVSSARRRGVLGLASLLAARAAPDGSSPVKRGIMIRVDLLCETVPPPIAGASFDKVMVTPDMQTRERFEALAAIPVCGGCHNTINPPGYLFEEFDQVGRHRDTEKGRPINAKGTLPPPLGGTPYPGVGSWDGMVPLADWMAMSPQARTCFAAHFASYLLSEAIPGGASNCMLPTITSRFTKSGRIDDLAEDLVKSELFLARSRGTP